MKNEEYTYDYKIDFQIRNPATIMLKDIKEESNVLELGPSTGYMTKYLSEVLKCKVTCIEIDEKAAEIAKQYSEKMIVGSLDKLNLEEVLQEKYDYVLMADVLEHLFEPEVILKQIKKILKPEGILWLSIPNISHISIIQQLIENQFTYGKWGLLDNTHIRFFTRNTIVALLGELEYKIQETQDIIKYPIETEFNSKHLETEFIKNIIQEKNPDLYTYQMVFKLKLMSADDDMKVESDIDSSCLNRKEYESKLYIDFGDGFNEENTLATNCNCINNKFYITFKSFDHIKKIHSVNIRLDLLEGRYSYIKILGASYKDHKNITRSICLENLTHNANIVKDDNGMYFFDYDPQIYFNMENIYLRDIRVWGECKTEEDLEVSKYLYESSQEKYNEYLVDLTNRDKKMQEQENTIKLKDNAINECNENIEEQQIELRDKDDVISECNKNIEELQIELRDKDYVINECNKNIEELQIELRDKDYVINACNKNIEEQQVELRDKIERIREHNEMSLIKKIRKQI